MINRLFLRLVCVLILCLVFRGEAKPDDWGVATNNLQMSISIKKTNDQQGVNQPLVLLIRYHNCSTNEVFHIYEVSGTTHDPSYSFAIVSPKGRTNNILPVSQKYYVPESGMDHMLDPSQIIQIQFDLGEIFKFSEVGTYKIIAKKRVFGRLQNG